MIFVDTSFWVALRNRRDAHHEEAVGLLKKYSRSSLTTSNHVQGETWTFLRRRIGHQAAVGFLDAIGRSRVIVTTLDLGLETEALDWLRSHDEREYSFVDATSFAFMRRNKIKEALAFDGDFSAAGFIELRY